MIVVTTGGRDYKPTAADAWALRAALRMHGATVLRHGGCRGVDRWSGRVAARLGIAVEVWPPTNVEAKQWPAAGPCQRLIRPATGAAWPSAGPRRSRAMLAGKGAGGRQAAALVSLPGGTGTAQCVDGARELGVPVTFVNARAAC